MKEPGTIPSLSRLARNAGWNLAGVAIPVVAALVSIPILIRTIGDERFGFLSIAWVLVGYFGLFDLGISRALTHGLARRQAAAADGDLASLMGTGLSVMAAIGVLAAVVLAVSSGALVHRVLAMPDALRGEGATGLVVLSCSLPFVMVSAGLRGILEARQAFKVVNLVVMPIGTLLYVGPLLVSRFSVSLPHLFAALLVLRVASCALLLAACVRQVPRFLELRVTGAAARELLASGGWMTVSNVVSPIMVNMDRLFIGALVSVAAVTYYVTPFEVVSKLLIVPSAIAGASFPEFSRYTHEQAALLRRYFAGSLRLVLLVLVPAAAILFAGAHWLLAIWVSPELADRSATIMRVLTVGVVVNGAAYIAFAFVQGLGRSDVTARFHLVELLVYAPVLVLLIRHFGVMGVALAWVFRVTLDATLLFGYAASRLRPRFDQRVGQPTFEPGGR